MKPGVLVALAVAVLVPSLSESRIVSKCELKDQLSAVIKLPGWLEKHRETILEVVTYSSYRKSRLNTSLVRVFGKRITTTTAKPTTVVTTLSTSGGNETTTEGMTAPTDRPNTTESVTTNPVTTNSVNGTNSTDGSRRKREVDSATKELEPRMNDSFEETGNEEENDEEEEIEEDDNQMGDEDKEEDNVDEDEGNKDEEEGNEDEEGGNEDEEGGNEDEEGGNEDEGEGNEDEEGGNEDEEGGNEEKEENNGDEEENNGDEEEGKEEEEELEEEEEEEEEGDEDKEGGKRKKRWLRKSMKKHVPKSKLSLKKKWIRHWSLGFYGLFQLSDRYFCESGYRWSANRCKTSCTAFTDDEISDDIACFVKTRRFSYWRSLLRKARWYNPAKGFLKECN